MQQLKSQIDELDKQIAVEVNNIKASVRSEYEAAQSQEAMLQKQMDVLKTQVLDQQNRSIRYNVLKREVDTNRQLYDGLLQRYKEIGVAGGVTTNNMSVVDRADIPGGPYKPSLSLNLMLATFFGLALGVILALFFEYLDDTLKTTDDVEKQLGLPVLGIIPKLTDTTPRQALENQRSAFTEAYRSVRTALQFSTASGVPRTLLVTSSVPGEGKSTTAFTLAHNFAQLGKRVLLIDADLRNPSLHRTLGLDNEAGLSNCLAGAAKPQDVIRTQSEANLDVMTSGPLPPNPAELLSGPKMLALLTVAMSKYDQIIVDGPPTMGIADAPILSHIAKGTLLIVDAGRTRRDVARGSVKRLRAAHAHLLGALLTKCDGRMGGYGYGYSNYDYYYAYGEGTPKLTRQ
jgi:capsular exopolysaccharide synthesis family protein